MCRGVQCLILSPFLANCARFICIEIDILMFEGALTGTGKVLNCNWGRTAVVPIENAERLLACPFSTILAASHRLLHHQRYNQHWHEMQSNNNLSVTSDFQHALSLFWSTPCPNHPHACDIVTVLFLLPFCSQTCVRLSRTSSFNKHFLEQGVAFLHQFIRLWSEQWTNLCIWVNSIHHDLNMTPSLFGGFPKESLAIKLSKREISLLRTSSIFPRTSWWCCIDCGGKSQSPSLLKCGLSWWRAWPYIRVKSFESKDQHAASERVPWSSKGM